MTSRTLVPVAVAGLTLSLAVGGLLVPSPAAAVVLGTPVTTASTVFGKAGACTFSPSATPNTTDTGAFVEDGVPVTKSTSSSTTISQAGDSSTASASVTHTVTATAANGALKNVHIVDALQASVNADLGAATTCAAAAAAAALTQFTFDLPTAKYLLFEADEVNTQMTVLIQKGLGGPDPVVEFDSPVYAPHHMRTVSVFLPAGSYQGLIQHVVNAHAPSATNTITSRTGKATVDLTFEEPGAAMAAAEGDGGKYVDLAAGRSCGTASLAATWKSKAGKGKNVKVKKATFYVNGVKVKSVKKPKKKDVTTLPGLDPLKTLDVLVKVKLVKHGAGTVTVERSYLPCS